MTLDLRLAAQRAPRAPRAIGALLVIVFMAVAALAPVAAQGVYPLPEALPGLALRVTGTVHAIAPYGSGYVLGGDFDHVNGQPRGNLAYIGADGELADAGFGWISAGSNGPVHALAVSGDSLYVAGDFSAVGAAPRTYVAKLSLIDGTVVPGFAPVPNAPVRALAADPDNGGVFIGGDFTSVDNVSRARSAKLDDTGAVAAWVADYKDAVTVNAIAYDGAQGWVYVGGNLRLKNGGLHRAVARLHPVTGMADPAWRLKVNPRGAPQVHAIAIGADHVYLGGQFSRLDNVNRANIARVDRVDGDIDRQWNPGANGAVRGFSIDGDGVVVGGDFTFIGGAERHRLARIAASGAADPAVVVDADRPVLAMHADGSGLLVGGAFRTINGSPEEGLARLDASSVPDPGFPTVIGGPGRVLGMATDPAGGTVVGGVFDFAVSDGVVYARSNLLRLAPDHSLDTNWVADVASDVQAVAVDVAAGQLYIGGSFAARLARYDITGAVPVRDAWAPSPDGAVRGIVLDGTGGLYVYGDFAFIGGAARNGVARLAGSSADGWDPAPDGRADALVVGGGNVFLGGECLYVSGGECSANLARVDSASGAVEAPYATTNGAVSALLLEGARLYVGGAFDEVDAAPRGGIARLDTAAGMLDADWAPLLDGPVRALATDPSRGWVYAGGRFTSAGGAAHPNLMRAGSAAPAVVDPGWRPGTDRMVTGMLPLADGSLLVAGNFQSVSGVQRQALARLGHDGSDATAIIIDSIAPTPAAVGQPWTIAFSVDNLSNAGVTAAGSVMVSTDAGESCGPVTIDAAGQGSCAITGTSIGARQVTAVFSGQAPFLDSTSASVAQELTSSVAIGHALTRIAVTQDGAVADGMAANSVQVTLVDADGAPVAGVAVSFSHEGEASLQASAATTGADGTVAATLTSTLAGAVHVSASFDASGDGTPDTAVVNGAPAQVDFVAGPVDPDPQPDDPDAVTTRIRATDAEALADGIDSGSIAVTLVDAFDNPVPGVRVALQASGGTLQPASALSDAQGQVLAALVSTVAGVVEVTARYDSDGDDLADADVLDGTPAQVLFLAGEVDPGPHPQPEGHTRIEVLDGSALADGADAAAVQVHLRDAFGNPVPGVAVGFDYDAGQAQGQASSALSDATGQVTLTLTSSVVGTLAITASYDSDGDGAPDAQVLNGSPASVDFTLAATTTLLQDRAPAQTVVGQAYLVSFTVESAAGTPTGTVLVSDGASSCNVALDVAAAGAGSCELPSMSAGTVQLVASFAGSGVFADSSSAAMAHTIERAATAVTLGASSTLLTEGDEAVFTWTVPVLAPGAGSPAGEVVVSAGALACSAPVAAGGCALLMPEAGNFAFSALYAGDADFLPSESAALVIDVQAGGETPPADVVVRHEIVRSGILSDGSGDLVDYELEVSNSGGLDANTVDVDMLMPAEFTDIAWTCSATGGGVCGTAAGNGDVMLAASLPAGSSVLVELSVRVVDPEDRGVATAAFASTTAAESDTGNNSATTFYRSCSGSELLVVGGFTTLPAHVCGFRDGFEGEAFE